MNSSLWRRRDFVLLLGGQGVSELGSSISYVALPLVALTQLNATNFEVSVLVTLSSLAFLVFSLPIGVLADRRHKKNLMLMANICRALLLLTVPLLAALDSLTITHLYLTAFLVGVLTVLFDISYQSFIPSVVAPSQIVEANGKLSTTRSLSVVLGPPVGGALVSALGPARAVVADSLSYVVSALALIAMRGEEPRPAPANKFSWSAFRAETAEGLSFVFSHPVLRKVVACTATSNLFGAVYFALEMVFFVNELRASPLVIGLAVSASGIGGVLGGLLAHRLSAFVGSARMIWLSILGLGWTGVLLPLAPPGAGIVVAMVGLFGFALSSVLYNTAQVSYRQSICPPELLGRVNASVRWVVWGALPLGGLLGGVLATAVGLRETLLIAGLGGWLAGLWVWFSPLRGMREIPEAQPARAS